MNQEHTTSSRLVRWIEASNGCAQAMRWADQLPGDITADRLVEECPSALWCLYAMAEAHYMQGSMVATGREYLDTIKVWGPVSTVLLALRDVHPLYGAVAPFAGTTVRWRNPIVSMVGEWKPVAGADADAAAQHEMRSIARTLRAVDEHAMGAVSIADTGKHVAAAQAAVRRLAVYIVDPPPVSTVWHLKDWHQIASDVARSLEEGHNVVGVKDFERALRYAQGILHIWVYNRVETQVRTNLGFWLSQPMDARWKETPPDEWYIYLPEAADLHCMNALRSEYPRSLRHTARMVVAQCNERFGG